MLSVCSYKYIIESRVCIPHEPQRPPDNALRVQELLLLVAKLAQDTDLRGHDQQLEGTC